MKITNLVPEDVINAANSRANFLDFHENGKGIFISTLAWK
jgi:hypothetical protein